MSLQGTSGDLRSRRQALLRCIRQELDTLIKPELQSDQARNSAFLIGEMLACVAVDACPGDNLAADWRQEQAELHALDADVRAELTPRPDPLAAVETPVDPAALQAYFKAREPAPELGQIEAVEQIAGGYSKDTWRVRASKGIDNHRHMVLRRDLPFGPGENTVSDELQLLRDLHANGLPVPEPLWHCGAASPVGQPFLLFPQIPGSAVFGDWHAEPGLQRHILHELARVMAQLHSLPVATLASTAKLNAAATPTALVRQYVQSWYDKWQRRQVTPSRIMETAYQWLLDNVPTGLHAPSIVHGDISLRNTLIDGDRLTALLDWEFWHLGDPMEDLSYFRLVAEPYIDWVDFMAAYREAGGPDYDEARADYYAVWRSVRNATTTTTAWHGFLSGAYPVSKAAYQGVLLYHFFLRDIATQLDNRGVR